MISSVDELDQAKAVLGQCARELTAEKLPHNERPSIGIMVELPAALDIIDGLAAASDFFSIGTNDLIQYLLAVDRTNEKVAKFFCPHHPSVLRAIKRIADAAAKARIEVSVCGDMAHESRYLEFLIGAGIRAFSVDPLYFDAMLSAVQKVDTARASLKARHLLSCDAIRDIEEALNR